MVTTEPEYVVVHRGVLRTLARVAAAASSRPDAEIDADEIVAEMTVTTHRAVPMAPRVLTTPEDRDAWLQALAEDGRDCMVRDAYHRCWWVTSAPEDGPCAVRWLDTEDSWDADGPTVAGPVEAMPLPLTVLWDGTAPDRPQTPA